MSDTGQPSIAGFTTFIRNVMGIGANYLPDSSPSIQHAYDYAINTVNLDLACAPSQPTSWGPYQLAVYNLGGHVLIEFAQDQSYAIATLAWSAGSVAGTTSLASALQPGNRVAITGVSPLAYSGPPNLGYVVLQSAPDSTHFGYDLAKNPGAATLLAGAAVTVQFFSLARARLKIGEFAPGVVGSTSDVSTSVGLNNPEFTKGLTIENLGLLKTTYGRAYMSIAQKYGPTVWGLS